MTEPAPEPEKGRKEALGLHLPNYTFRIPEIYFQPLATHLIDVTEATKQIQAMLSVPSAAALAKVHIDMSPIKAVLDAHASWAADFTKQMAAAAETYRRFHVELMAPLRQAGSDLIRFIGAASDHDWPPPMGMSIAHMRAGLKSWDAAAPEKKSAVMRDIIVKGYDKRAFSEIHHEWQGTQWLGKRARILDKALEAHMRGEYELSVPALIAQVEGLVAETAGHSGRMSQAHWTAYVKLLYATDLDPTKSDEAAAKFITGNLLVHFFWGSPIPQTSRHAILHGADVDYATEENSLKMVILLSDLVGTCDEYRTKNTPKPGPQLPGMS